jgi:hypothetical protein
MSKAKLRIAGMFSLLTTCALVYGAISVTFPTGLAVSKAAHVPQDSFTAYCDYNPDESVFKAGKQAIYHPTQSAAIDRFIILLPIVNQKFNRTGITLLKDDRVAIRACGCVQTGGTGKSWKRYVNPSGPNSDKLYHGVIPLDNFIIIPPQGTPASCCGSSPTIPGALRISDMIAAQTRGFQFQLRKQTELVLGYEDDDYGDNSYSGHDDGTENQCRGVGGAAVEITIRHKSN